MRRYLLAATTACLLLSTGAAVRAQDMPALRIGLADDADLLDPTLARTFVGRIVFAGLCDKLFDINEKLQVVPQLATGYEWSDSKTLIIQLRNGVLFHDGTKMDAAAVKYSLERHMNMPGSGRRGEIAGMEKVEIVDPMTLRITLKSPNAPFIAQLTDRAGMIVSPKAAEAAGKDFGLHPVCAGPFKFTERVPQDRIVIDRFAEYWNAPAIKLSRITYRPIPDSSVRLANLQAGALDMVERIAPTDVAAIRADPKLKLSVHDALGYQSINFNVAHGPRAQTPIGQDARVRQAFELAIDREALVQVVYSGMFTPSRQAVPPDSPFFAPDVKPPARDVARAKALLQQAGVKLPVPVTLTVTNAPDQRQSGEVIQAMAGEAGFDVKLQSVEFTAGLDAADRGDFEAYLTGWSGRADADGSLWNFVHSGAPLNYPGYSSPKMDGLLEQARAVTDTAARQALYAQVGELTATDLPIMYLYITKNIVGMTAKLSGFQPVADGMLRPQGMVLGK
jgi:peptide/nickel transport system substrate-binding protein